MNDKVKILLVALLFAALAPALCAMQQTIGLRGGLSYPLNDVKDTRDLNPAFGISYEAWLKDYLSLGIYPYSTTLSGKDKDVPVKLHDYETSVLGADIMAKLRPTKTLCVNFSDGALKRIAPFVELGLGASYYDNDIDDAKAVLVAPSAGAGVSFLTKWNVNLDLGVQFEKTWDDNMESLENDKAHDSYLMPFLGLGYTFGKSGAGDGSKYEPKKITRYQISMKEDFILKGVQFEFDSADLTYEAKTNLDDVVKALKQNPKVKLRIQGYTDSVGDDQYNYGLSLRRAESVKNYMVQKGVAAERLTTQGFGEKNPIASNDTPEGRAENRRIEFVIVK